MLYPHKFSQIMSDKRWRIQKMWFIEDKKKKSGQRYQLYPGLLRAAYPKYLWTDMSSLPQN